MKKTVKDLLEGKGKTTFTLVQVMRAEEAAAAAEAGIDMIGTGWLPERKDFPQSAPGTHFKFGLQFGHHVNADEALRDSYAAMAAGADSIYCPMSPKIVEVLAREGVPVIPHIGLVPPKATWTGGMRAVGKTWQQAVQLFQQVKSYEDAGAFGIEIEVVPYLVATEISKRTNLLTFSLGSGAGCDVQYLFSADLLGDNPGRIPRHAKAYRDFTAERARLQHERVAAYGEFITDVKNDGFPQSCHLVEINDTELEIFMNKISMDD